MCSEQCGRTSPPDERELLAAFEAATTDVFGFLTHGGLEASALEIRQLGGPGGSVPAASGVRYPFEAVRVFAGEDVSVRITYGGREFRLDVDVRRTGTGYRPWEAWLDALGIAFEVSDDSGVATPASIHRHTGRLAGHVSEHFDAIRRAGPEIMPGPAASPDGDRLHDRRDRANAAFAAGNYPAYVELLEPFESALTVTEHRKLEFARRRAPR